MPALQSYVEREPRNALSARVRSVWVQRTGPAPYVQRHLPTGGVELHCRVGDVPRVVGPLTTAVVELLPADTTVLGLRFWPGAATPLLGLPAEELVDQVVSLQDLWGSEAVLLGEELTHPDDADAALESLQRRLRHRQIRSPQLDPLVSAATRRLMPWPGMTIGSLTDELSISGRQLRRRFLTSVGLTPKSLQLTLRFQGYLAMAQAAGSPEPAATSFAVADLAADLGYSDHAHLARECQRLSGQTPTELLLGGMNRCGCGHDHVASYRPFLVSRPGVRSR